MKLVLIEWIDTSAGRGWQPLEDIDKDCQPVYRRSVGWLLADKNGCKTIVPHISEETNGDIMMNACGDIIMPTKSIVKMTV